MTICIIHDAGTYYTNAENVREVLEQVRGGFSVPVWWFAGNGQRFSEDMYFVEDHLIAVRTERDDG